MAVRDDSLCQVASRALAVVTGISAEGAREVLGVDLADNIRLADATAGTGFPLSSGSPAPRVSGVAARGSEVAIRGRGHGRLWADPRTLGTVAHRCLVEEPAAAFRRRRKNAGRQLEITSQANRESRSDSRHVPGLHRT